MKSDHQEMKNLNNQEFTNSMENEYCLEKAQSGKFRIKGDDLKLINIYAYGIGHVLNDLTATCWFSFLLYYLTDIVELTKHRAGLVMLSGQLFDGLATPLVGLLSDKYSTRIGRRTPWYLGGTIGVILCFSLIFQKCTICERFTNQDACEMAYYLTLPSLFNIAWASVQVAHMSLLPSISINKKNRDYMVRLRTAFTFLSQMSCLFMSFVIFYVVKDKYSQYSILTFACVGIGILSSLIFLYYCNEMGLSKNISKYYQEMREALNSGRNQDYHSNDYNTIDNRNQVKETHQEKIGVTYWLKKPLFYKYIVVYMLVRISINVTTSMLPYYLENVLGIKKTIYGGTPVQISLIYLFLTAGCLFNSLYFQKFLEKFNSRVILMFGALVFTMTGMTPLVFLDTNTNSPIYFLSFVFGIGFALALSTSSSLINDVVGSKGDQGAFVYGAYSLTDKFSCGIILFIFVEYKDNLFALKYVLPIMSVVAVAMSLVIVSYRRSKPDNTKLNPTKKGLELDNSKSIIDNSNFSFLSVE